MSIKDASAGIAIMSIPQDKESPIPNQAPKRPLRTYGRRTTMTPKDHERTPPKQRVENTALRQAIEETTRQEEEDSTIVIAASDSEPPSPLSIPPAPVQLKRTSILSYFKPVPSRPDETSSHPAPSGYVDEPTPTPPSPSPAFLPRKRRRLTTRPELPSKQPPASISDAPKETEPETKTTPPETNPPKKESKKKTQDTSPKGAHGAPFISVSAPVDLQRSNTSDDNPALHEIGASNLNQQQPDVYISNTRQPDFTSGGKKRARRPKKDLVQTTLSLAINPGPGFTICKDCGILYNPLNENDRTEHKRRHAAHVRSKGKGNVL